MRMIDGVTLSRQVKDVGRLHSFPARMPMSVAVGVNNHAGQVTRFMYDGMESCSRGIDKRTISIQGARRSTSNRHCRMR